MKEYTNKPLEELRLEDHVANRKDPQARFSTMFGTVQPIGGIFGQPSQLLTGLFGQLQTSQPSTGPFGSNNTGLGGSTFSRPSAFGQTTQANSLFGNRTFETATTQAGFGS